MSSIFEFLAESRSRSGTNGAKAVRRQGKVPAVIYGGSGEPQLLELQQNEVAKHLQQEAVYSHVLEIKIDGKAEKAILKGIQRHPSKAHIVHMDFLRVSASDKLRVHVPLHFMNEEDSVGVKKGGVVTHSMVDIEVNCLPSALPEYIEVDLSSIDVGESIHLADIKVPDGVEIIALAHEGGNELPVVSITTTRGGAASSEEDDEEGTSEADAE
jgi:large subunit ribosomal protein L25